MAVQRSCSLCHPYAVSLCNWIDTYTLFLVILSPNLLTPIINQTTLVLLPLQVIYTFVQEAR